MNNKEFISSLAKHSGYKTEDTQNMVRTIVYYIVDKLTENEAVALNGLGTFDVKKRLERIISNPISGQKMLVPPKLVVNFKPSKKKKTDSAKDE